MAENAELSRQEKAIRSLERIQEFDVDTLPQENRLGSTFAFHRAVEPAQRLVNLYKRLAVSVAEDLPDTELDQVTNLADQNFNRLDEILRFDPAQQNASGVRQSLIEQLAGQYQPTFNRLHPLISYSLYKTTDFRRLDNDARATLQSIRDRADGIANELEAAKRDAERILEEVREVAAEKGVTQQAIYSQRSGARHEAEAARWQGFTVWVAVGLTAYAVSSLFLHRFLDPKDTYEAVQIGVSKVLIFAVISYMLYFCARNSLSHRHNAVIDQHRQNALMTYQALMEAAGDTPNREVILVQAAACIFSPQGTGYSQDSAPPPPGAHSVVEFLTKPIRGTGG